MISLWPGSTMLYFNPVVPSGPLSQSGSHITRSSYAMTHVVVQTFDITATLDLVHNTLA